MGDFRKIHQNMTRVIILLGFEELTGAPDGLDWGKDGWVRCDKEEFTRSETPGTSGTA